MFPPHILLTAQHLFETRAGQRGLHWAHAQECAKSGVETVHDAEGLHHDSVVADHPDVTLRIVTNHAKTKAMTGYYLPTELAVRQREERNSRATAARHEEEERKAAARSTAHHTATSKQAQEAKQMARSHAAGEHTTPKRKCPDCQQ
jgi:hypothetical protein